MPFTDVSANRAATKYSKKELFFRVLWGFGKLVFRLTPRTFFGSRRGILRMFGAQIGANVQIYPSALIYFPWKLEIGENSSVGEWALIYNLGPVSIGRNVTVSQRVHLCAGTHDYKDPTMPLIKPPIVIEDGAWVCADAFVGPSVTVGANAIVGAAAAVFKDVATNEIVGGNPARFIKLRDDSESQSKNSEQKTPAH